MVFMAQTPRTFGDLLSLETTRLLLGRTPALDQLRMFGSVIEAEFPRSAPRPRGSGWIQRPGEGAEEFGLRLVDYVRP